MKLLFNCFEGTNKEKMAIIILLLLLIYFS